MADYKYNADDKDLAAWGSNFTNRLGDGSGDHELAYIDMLKLLIELKRQGALMDIGCGLGRVTALAKGNISRIVALEPDIERFRYCHASFHSPPECEILNQMSDEYLAANPGVEFDLIVLGMVIQHVSTQACTSLIKDACRLAKPEGVVIIATTHTPECLKGFEISGDRDNAYLSEGEYNDYAENPGSQDRGIPVRRFSRRDLESEVLPYFRILQWTEFSYYRPNRIGWFYKRLNTDAETLRDTGNSQFVVLRNRG